MTPQHQALQNAANDLNLEIREEYQQDKRKKVPKYFATYKGTTHSVGPVMDYTRMNHFLLGYREAMQHYTGKPQF